MAEAVKKQSRMLRLFARLEKLNEQRHLFSIRTAFIATMPIMIVGAFAVVINQLPLPFYQDFMQDLFGESWRMFGELCFNATTQIVTLMVVFAVCANLAQWYNNHKRTQVHSGICGFVGLASYIIVSLPVSGADSLSFRTTSVTGLFVAIVMSILCGEAFIHLCSRKKSAGLLSDDPNLAVPQSFVAVLPTIVILGVFALMRVVMVRLGVTEGFSDIVYGILSRPFVNYSDSFGSGMLFNVSTHVMWLFGIHGNNVLNDVAANIYQPAIMDNIAAVAAGLPPPNLLTKTLFDAFVYMGGSGTTLGLVISLFIFGKGRSYRMLMRYALPTSIFNINEPLIFGIPIVLNPIFAIPFVLTPVVMFSTSVGAMALGLVPYTIADISWATPVFISGYLATGSVAGIILQVVNLAIAVLIYAPFVRLSEKMAQIRFENAYKDLVKLVTTEYSASNRRLISRVDEMGAVARRLANQMDNALKTGEMYLNYQPIVDAKQCKMHSVEALLRWKHPQHGNINPMLVVVLAEETGRIDKLGLWILEQAMLQRAEWTAQGLPDFHVSVNVSTKQLNVPSFHQHVLDTLTRLKVPAHQLQVEITETAALVENEATGQNLHRLNDAGVTIAMDDFGVGHSSLLYLRTQPISTLKIDGSLSREIVKNKANLDIIATIHDLCKLLNVGTIIEYVDNTEQLELLMGIGAFLIQGYLFSQPIPGGEIPAFMQRLDEQCAAKLPLPLGAGEKQPTSKL